MRYVVVIPKRLEVNVVEADDIYMLYKQLDLEDVDHGIIFKGIAIVVGEHSLFEGQLQGRGFFSIGRHVFCGNAVMYAYDYAGEMIDMPLQPPPVVFYSSVENVKRAVQLDLITEPTIRINDEVTWRLLE